MEDPLIGQKLDEYRILALLGRGGMARVYLGLDVGLNRYVSIKVIDNPYRDDGSYVQRFEREAQAVAQLEHPNIVRLYRYGQSDGLLYMAMQYVRGADLEEVLDSSRQSGEFLPLADVLAIIRELGMALDYAHDKGVIHRDIKPANVILDEEGHPFLTDFGLALLAEMADAEDVFGTPQYMAPEQFAPPHKALPESDLYALGIVLYEMITGQLPFDAPDEMQVAWRQVNQAPRPPRDVRPGLSPAIEAVVLKSLAKDPAGRYQSGAALAGALDRALNPVPDSPAQAAPALPPQPVAGQSTGTQAADRTGAPLSAPKAPAVASAASAAPGAPSRPGTPPRRPVVVPPPPPRPVSGPPRRPAPVRQKPAPSRRLPRVAAGCLAVLLLGALVAGVAFVLLGPGRDLVRERILLPVVTRAADVSPDPAQPTPTLQPTWTPAPTEAPLPTETPVPTDTVAPTDTTVPTDTPQPTATATLEWTPTPTATAEPSPTPAGTAYSLLIAIPSQDNLIVMNRGAQDFPLAPLYLGNRKGSVEGFEWEVDRLPPGACVSIWKTEIRSRPPGVDCVETGTVIRRDANEVFWQQPFEVYYMDEGIGICLPQGCEVEIPIH